MTESARLLAAAPRRMALADVRRLFVVAAANRFVIAVLGPMSVAAANAVLQFVMLQTLPQAAFGQLAFLLGLTQFGYGLSNALVGTPYTLEANSGRPAAAHLYGRANLLLSGLWGLLCALAASMLGGDRGSALFGCFAALAMVRWFGRSHHYALHRPGLVAVSDLTYAVVLLAGAGLMLAWRLPASGAVLILCAAAAGGLLALGRPFLGSQAAALRQGPLRGYGAVWRDQARWTLVGVLSSEATANAHSYAVSLIAGPAAFAPIAAASLLIKPIMLVITSLTQLERPAMARHIAAGDMGAARRSAAVFRLAVLAAWAGTTALAAFALLRFPHLLAKPSYDPRTLELAFALWAGIALLQCWSTPPNVLLQAAQWFRPLAGTQTRAAAIALVAVVACAVVLPPVDTLGGILLGQLVMTVGVGRLAARWARLSPAGRGAA